LEELSVDVSTAFLFHNIDEVQEHLLFEEEAKNSTNFHTPFA
jgi:hypothetical protein